MKPNKSRGEYRDLNPKKLRFVWEEDERNQKKNRIQKKMMLPWKEKEQREDRICLGNR